MNQSFAVWLLIALSLVAANLPFLVERPFLALPWQQKGEPARAPWLVWTVAILFFAMLVGVAYLTLVLIGDAFITASDPASVALFMGKIALVAGLAGLLLAWPGRRNRGCVIQKSFFVRLLELTVFYCLIGMLGFAFETNMGSLFGKTWEFYAVTFSLFLVLGYPGFVYRYLLRRRKAPAKSPLSAA
ncbi:MAG TPA: DUF2818 family protein [Candidimonas sp.]|nr:DUF2818 family protein [Candidimonas sp.]